MILDATCQLDYQTMEEVPTIFMLRPRSGCAQTILQEEFRMQPQVAMTEFTDLFGNWCQRTVMPVGHFGVFVRYRVSVADWVDVREEAMITPAQYLPTEVLPYLLPSRYCQSDMMSDLANSIVGQAPRTYQMVELLRTWVFQQVRYEPGASDSSTSALDTEAQRRGVCRDFAHLGMSLCRALDIPARMVVGFLHRFNPMDLHAWFEAFIDGRWYAFDATEASTRGCRIVIAYGRDAADVALATMFGSFTLQQMHVTVEEVTGNGF